MRILSILLLTTAAAATACAGGTPELRQPVGQTIVTSSAREKASTDDDGNGSASCKLDRVPEVHFDPGSRDLAESETSALRHLGSCLTAAAHETSNVVLVGYTDVLGTSGENLVLGLSRAQTVMRQLMDSGVSPGRIVIASAGELQRPNASLGLQADRVEILIVRGGPSRPDEPPIARGIDARGLLPRPARVDPRGGFAPRPGARPGPGMAPRGYVRAAPPRRR